MKKIVLLILIFHIFNVEVFSGITLSNLALLITILTLFLHSREIGVMVVSLKRERILISSAILSFFIGLPFLDLLTFINSESSIEKLIRSSVGWFGIGISIILAFYFIDIYFPD